jgi:hypothetical protein
LLTDSLWAPVVGSDDSEGSEEAAIVKDTNVELSESVNSDSSSVKTGIDFVEAKVSDQLESPMLNTDIDCIEVEVSGSCEKRLVDDAEEEALRVTVRSAWITRVVSGNQRSMFVSYVANVHVALISSTYVFLCIVPPKEPTEEHSPRKYHPAS